LILSSKDSSSLIAGGSLDEGFNSPQCSIALDPWMKILKGCANSPWFISKLQHWVAVSTSTTMHLKKFMTSSKVSQYGAGVISKGRTIKVTSFPIVPLGLLIGKNDSPLISSSTMQAMNEEQANEIIQELKLMGECNYRHRYIEPGKVSTFIMIDSSYFRRETSDLHKFLIHKSIKTTGSWFGPSFCTYEILDGYGWID
jgi:hypothetical protein